MSTELVKLDIANNKKGGNGWVCLDIEPNADVILDLNEDPLPYENNSVDAIYSSHTLEHLWPDRLNFVLQEFYRVLKPNQPVRVAVPDMELVIKAYTRKDQEFLSKFAILAPGSFKTPLRYMISWAFSYFIDVDNIRKFGHVSAFDEETLALALGSAGFKNIQRMKFNLCSNVFEGCDVEGHKETSLYMEATK